MNFSSISIHDVDHGLQREKIFYTMIFFSLLTDCDLFKQMRDHINYCAYTYWLRLLSIADRLK